MYDKIREFIEARKNSPTKEAIFPSEMQQQVDSRIKELTDTAKQVAEHQKKHGNKFKKSRFKRNKGQLKTENKK